MNQTERYRTQHAEILRLATDLGQHLSSPSLAQNAAEARAILSELSGKLLVHLAAEDNLLYPKLLNATAPATQQAARRFQAEMGSISQAFKQYAVRWASTQAIQANAPSFISETRSIIAALGERIKREHAELYPLADAL